MICLVWNFSLPSREETPKLRTCEKITKCRVAAGFLAWPRREGGGNTRSGVADALHRPAGCLRQAVSLRSAVPPEQRRSSQKDTQPCGREQERPSGRVAGSVTARCGDAPSRAPCHTTFLALVRRFLIFSQVLRRLRPSGRQGRGRWECGWCHLD